MAAACASTRLQLQRRRAKQAHTLSIITRRRESFVVPHLCLMTVTERLQRYAAAVRTVQVVIDRD